MGLFGKKKTEPAKVEAVVKETPAEPVVATEKVERPEGHLVFKIFCSAGMSTSLWAQKVQKQFEAENRDMEIAAYSISELDDYAPKADVILIGPQTRFVEPEVKKNYPDKIVAVVPMTIFGRMDAVASLKFIDELL